MGNLPCVLYCNFDLFWAGEQLQVVRQAALDGELHAYDGGWAEMLRRREERAARVAAPQPKVKPTNDRP